jgi:long-chain acyl-CoA synthetase
MAVGDVTDRRSREVLRKCRPTVFVGVPRVFEAIMDSVRTAVARSGRLAQFERAQALSALVKRATGVNVGRALFRRLHRELFGGLQLRFCVSGGARISPRLLGEYFLLGIPIVQGWGMSELSPVGAAQPFRPARFYFARHYERKAGSIGTPLDGTDILLAKSDYAATSATGDDHGEIVVRGRHVMRGYHNDPVRSAQQMSEQGLRSGDVARRDKDGDLYVIGRIKHVIVLPSGKKVFPEQDLDEELSRCPTIREFAVRPIEDESGREKIGIVIRPNLGELKARGVRTLGELYAAIKKDLDDALDGKPDYMKEYDFCLTPWRGDGYAEVVKTAMGEPSPLRTPFHSETAYSRMKGSTEKVPFEA